MVSNRRTKISLSSILLKSTCRVKRGPFRLPAEASEHYIFLMKKCQACKKNTLFEVLFKFIGAFGNFHVCIECTVYDPR